MRMVVDLSDLDASRWISLTGASGHAFSAHYDDQAPLWARGELADWPFSPEALAAATDDLLTLQPADHSFPARLAAVMRAHPAARRWT